MNEKKIKVKNQSRQCRIHSSFVFSPNDDRLLSIVSFEEEAGREGGKRSLFKTQRTSDLSSERRERENEGKNN